jgi:hypothetical protein
VVFLDIIELMVRIFAVSWGFHLRGDELSWAVLSLWCYVVEVRVVARSWVCRLKAGKYRIRRWNMYCITCLYAMIGKWLHVIWKIRRPSASGNL